MSESLNRMAEQLRENDTRRALRPYNRDTLALALFVDRCHEAGIIDDEQRGELDGITAVTNARKVLRTLIRGLT